MFQKDILKKIWNYFKIFNIDFHFFDTDLNLVFPEEITNKEKLIEKIKEFNSKNISQMIEKNKENEILLIRKYENIGFIICKILHNQLNFQIFIDYLDNIVHYYELQKEFIIDDEPNKISKNIKNFYYKEEEIRRIFQRYIPHKFVEEILNNPEEELFKGYTKDYTILFTDIRGFTRLAETLTENDLVNILNEYFNFIIDIILENNGDIYKFIGDGIMAVFEGDKSGALSSICSSLKIKQELNNFNNRLKSNNFPEINMGIGIHTGKVFVGNIGNKKRSDFTLIGDTVNIASRLEGLTKMYNTFLVITDTTYKLVQEHIIAREIDSLRLKGKQHPLVVYDVIGPQEIMNDKIKILLEEYNQGLILYRIKEWDEAINHFKKALSVNKNDGPTMIYIERCSKFTFAPPDEDWDGITDMDQIDSNPFL